LDAAEAFAHGELERSAELYAEIGARPEEAFARLRAAARAVREGRSDEGRSQLDRALDFFREAGADAYVRDAEALAQD
jgi:hypothetical protein